MSKNKASSKEFFLAMVTRSLGSNSSLIGDIFFLGIVNSVGY